MLPLNASYEHLSLGDEEQPLGPIRLMVYAAVANTDLLWEKNTAEWLADSDW
jgi:hypothetical protein